MLLFFVLGVLFFVFFFRGFFFVYFTFLYFEEVFDEVVVEEKKRVGIIMSDRKLLFFWGYQKVFDPKNNSLLLLFFAQADTPG